MDLLTVLLIIGGLFFLLVCVAFVVSRFYRQVSQGQVLIVNPLRGDPIVTFTGTVVWPIVNRSEVMEIALKTVEIERRGKEGLICQDNIRADIKVTFFVRVNKTREDVLKVAQSIGCARASDQETLEALFEAKFSEALKTVGKMFDFADLYTQRVAIKDEVVRVIGQDLNGYMLEDCAIDFLEQTPVEMLDKDNILDAEGIRKITKLTTEQNVHTNELRQAERMAITKRNVEADEAIFALEQQRAKAAALQKAEVEIIQAEESARAERVKAEKSAEAQKARIEAAQEIEVSDQNKQREVQVAQKNREKVVAMETERVERARALEAIAREREVELERIAKEKALEEQKEAIAKVVRTRIVVDKTVAQEEESIKDLRVKAEAERMKEAKLINARAEAEQKLVKDIEAAKASNEVAKLTAQEKLTLAEADLQAADKTAKAKIRLAEGVQAESAAEGLAEVRVKEADALAIEKQGLAHVRVKEAEANAIELQGKAQASVAREKGLAEAQATRERLLAEAAGEQEKGMAHARIQEAEALAIQKRGEAEAISIQSKLQAEARGLAEKAQAMKELEGAGREHEEFRLRLQKERDVELAAINIRKEVAESQARVLSEALKNARFNIVGGDGAFFERFVRAVSVGQSLDGAVENSDVLRKALGGYLSGEKDLGADLKEILSKPGLTNDAQNLAVAALLSRMAVNPAAAAVTQLKGAVESTDKTGSR